MSGADSIYRAAGTCTWRALLGIVGARDASFRGYALTPRQAVWLDIGGASSEHLPLPPSDEVFEGCLFSDAEVFRWLRAAGGGRGAWLSESSEDAPEGWSSTQVELVGKNKDCTYLLWGRGIERKGEATVMSSPRVKPYTIPAAIELGHAAVLHAVEYFAELDDEGNVGVIDERPCGLRQSKHKPENSAAAGGSA